MANLIITIIAIALVAVAALMGAYYGGTAFNSGHDAAKATSLLNQAAQLQAAAQMYVAQEGVALSTVTTTNLSDNGYINAVPKVDGVSWTITNGVATWTSAVSIEMCEQIDGQNGMAVLDSAACATVGTGVTFQL